MAFKPEEHFRQLKGQNYLDCVWRVVWVREEHPDAQIDTEVVYWDHDTQEIMVRAVVVLPKTGARAVAHCMCSQAEFKFGYAEKAETQAVGRALALLGYGTAFAGADLDEGERVADSPTAARNGGGAGASAPPVGAQREATGKPPASPAARSGAPTVTAPVPQPQADPHAALRAEVAGALKVDTEAASKLPKGAQEMSGAELEKTHAWLANRALRQAPAAREQAADPAPAPNAERPTPSADEEAWPRSAADWSRAQLRERIQEMAGHALTAGKEWKALAAAHGQPDVASSAEMTQGWLLGLYQAMRAQEYQEMIASVQATDADAEERVTQMVAEALSERDRRCIGMAHYDEIWARGEARKAELSAPLLAGGQGRAQVAS